MRGRHQPKSPKAQKTEIRLIRFCPDDLLFAGFSGEDAGALFFAEVEGDATDGHFEIGLDLFFHLRATVPMS